MRRLYDVNEDGDSLVVGTAREIRSLVNHLWDRWDEFTPSCCEYPKFNPDRMYGVEIDRDGNFTVMNASTILRVLFD